MNIKLNKVIAVCGLSFISATALAGNYPDRPIRLIHGFGAGGNADSVARVIGSELEKRLGQSVVVESRTGAGGTIASGFVAKSPPDGYTLIMLTGGHTASAAMRKTLPYDPVADFSPISTVTVFPFVVAVRTEHPAKTLTELLTKARGASEAVTFSSVGVGSTQHLTGELLSSAAKAKMLHVPYRGGGAPAVAVIAGEVDVLVDTATVAGPQIAAGKLRALGVTSAKPWPALAGVPPVAQALPGFEVMSWLGLAAPAKTPADIIEKINATLADISKDPAVQKTIGGMGSQTDHMKPQEMRNMIERDITQWKQVVQEAAIPLQ
ncbi:MAG TPA: tripartite tricarboxylate transporter substrate binding protein [Eoetvoesiella sp.]